ncbi:hypothetical protein DPMN_075561 [Dreissena polymorpha]|uniref:Uncharacterized protein n=1 Tax=Dreissena polymorpha TaxID=45954 RepID=A0A9D3YH17_DREPO|nr:hypothetical protein DPMN_075561 [Dreissena polymorpha]
MVTPLSPFARLEPLLLWRITPIQKLFAKSVAGRTLKCSLRIMCIPSLKKILQQGC